MPQRSAELAYCRAVLKSTIQDVHRFRPTMDTTDVWVREFRPGRWEFMFPGFYWYGKADNAYEARSAGWKAWLKKEGCPEYQDTPTAEQLREAE